MSHFLVFLYNISIEMCFHNFLGYAAIYKHVAAVLKTWKPVNGAMTIKFNGLSNFGIWSNLSNESNSIVACFSTILAEASGDA